MTRLSQFITLFVIFATPMFAEHEADFSHAICETFAAKRPSDKTEEAALEIILTMCDYIKQLESQAQVCTQNRASFQNQDLPYLQTYFPYPFSNASIYKEIEGNTYLPINFSFPAMTMRQGIAPRDSRNLFTYRYYPQSELAVITPMTEIGLEVRRDAGVAPVDGELLQCQQKTENFPVKIESKETHLKRVRLDCRENEFIVTGLVF